MWRKLWFSSFACLKKNEIGRDEKIRTSDLQHPMLARYLATLRPDESLQIQREDKNTSEKIKFKDEIYINHPLAI